MPLRWKVLILLVVIALLPLLATTWISRERGRALGAEMAAQTRALLSARATELLQRIVQESADLLERERDAVNQCLRTQARDLEQLLATPPGPAVPVYFASDFDDPARVPPDTRASGRHWLRSEAGPVRPIPVSYAHPVFWRPAGVEPAQVQGEVERLARAGDAFAFVREGLPDLIFWQYATLASGLHTSYPGHGGYPPEYDGRERPWYARALEQGDLAWSPATVDAATGDVMLVASTPLRGPDGTPLGVTAIDIRLADLLGEVMLPEAWRASAYIALTTPGDAGPGEPAPLWVTAELQYLEQGLRWDQPIVLQRLRSPDAAGLAAMAQEIRRGRTGVHDLPFEGAASLWAHCPLGPHRSALVVVVPVDVIVRDADLVEHYILAQIDDQVRWTGLLVLAVTIIVGVVALVSSRGVTAPVQRLAEAAREIASGDLDARADVHRRDELGELGETFNAMVPKLQERLHLRESLSLAMQVQQHLLPASPPAIAGLDLAGTSVYCDETGGDYFDFLDVAALGERRLALAVGDVTGHGIAAALLMTTARALLRSHAGRDGSTADMMGTVNRHLVADTPSGRFMTMYYLLVDTAAGTMRWVGAGHDAAIVYRPDEDRFDELAGSDIPLGIDESWSFTEHAVSSWVPGMVVLIGTDGIWESRDPEGRMYGKGALREVMRRNAGAPAEAIVRAVLDDLDRFRAGGPQEDDVTMVALKVVPG